jgi:hypothetical protein
VHDAEACALPGRTDTAALVATNPPPTVPEPDPDACARALAPPAAPEAELLAR